MTSNELSLTANDTQYNVGVTSGGCITTWPNTWQQTYPNYVYIQGDAVTITVVETIDGFKGQISLKLGNQNIIVWESSAFHKDDFSVIKTKDGTVPPAPLAQARQAAHDAAELRAEQVLKGLFHE